MQVSSKEFQEHVVFQDLDHYISYYGQLARLVFPWASPGTGAFTNIDTYLYSSIQGTVASIRLILRDGRINDAYALLRKYYDSTVINIYSTLYLADHVSIDNFVVAQINDWLKGKSTIPEYRVMARYIRSSLRVADLTNALHSDDRYRKIRNRCNDHTHYNFYLNAILNDNEIHLPERNRVLETLREDVRDVFIFHMAYTIVTQPHYMMARDYLDSLECNMTPAPGSEYWVAPFFQEAYSCFLDKFRPDISLIVKSHTSMQLE